MYPSKQKAYAGIFVKNQFDELKTMLNQNDILDIYFMRRQFTSRWGSLVKYLKAFVSFIPYFFKKYDIVHLHFFHPLIYLVWSYKKLHPKTKVVVTFHGIDITQKVNKKNQRHFQSIAKVIDHTIPVGKTLALLVQEKLKLKIGSTLPVGVNNNVFYVESNVDKIYDFIFIGSFIHRKGIDTVLDAIKELNNQNASFCFCGSGEYLKDLIELQKDYNITIKQNQTQHQLRRLLNQSRFFLIMSRNEGFPTATIEAMYCGVPVITSDIPQFKEQVQDCYNGYLISLDDYMGLANKMQSLLLIQNNEYLELSNGASNSFKELSLKNVCKELISIYRNLN